MLLSCGETVLASQTEVDEFYSLVRALGMDREEVCKESDVPSVYYNQPSVQDTDMVVHVEEKDILEVSDQEAVQGTDMVVLDEEINIDMKNQDCDTENKSAEKELRRNCRKGSLRPNTYISKSEKEKMFAKLKSLIARGRNVATRMLPCPFSECRYEKPEVGTILYHLCSVHFRRELLELRRDELLHATTGKGRRNVCKICGTKQRHAHTLANHYGVVHRDVVVFAHQRGLLDPEQTPEQGRQPQNPAHRPQQEPNGEDNVFQWEENIHQEENSVEGTTDSMDLEEEEIIDVVGDGGQVG